MWICKNCNYSSKIENNECPYCGKKKSLEKEKNASELIEEINEMYE